jgi:hypothetical protein
MSFSPIVLFVYNRPLHTQKTIEALQNNTLAIHSNLFIYSDEAKNDDDRKSVDEVRTYIDNVDGFKKVTIIKRDKNWGLASSIIDGVTKIVDEYKKIIVLEDDLVTSPYFLKFMNDALEFYKDEEKVWHISGWSYPIDIDDLDEVFLWRLMNCWGWATWDNKWKYYRKDIDKTISEFNKEDIKIFNLDSAENFFGQIIANKERKINTWAIFWYATIFKEDAFCLNPSQTFVENIGHDGSGVHCGEIDTFKCNLSKQNTIKFINKVEENPIALERIQNFYKIQKKSLVVRVINKFSRIIFHRNLIK